MARNRSRRNKTQVPPELVRKEPPLDPPDTEVVDLPPPPPAPSEPLDVPTMLFEDLADEVPGLEELPDQLYDRQWRGELTGDARPPRQELDHEPQGLAELRVSDPVENVVIAHNQFDEAPIDPSPPDWENEHTPPVAEIDLPRSSDVVDHMLAENAQLKEAIEIAQATALDNEAEIERLRQINKQLSADVASFSELASSASTQADQALASLAHANDQNVRLEQLAVQAQGQIDTLQLMVNERDIVIQDLRCRNAVMTDQLKESEAAQLSLDAERVSVENRLVDSELTNADLEAQLDALRLRVTEMEVTLQDRKLWNVNIHVEAGEAVPRVYVLARNIAEAIDNTIKAGLAKADQITNVVEIKGIQIVA